MILTYSALSEGFGMSRFDTTYTHITARAVCMHGPHFG